ncbi:hypothetical protein [Methylobacterium marchantiae]|uniref:hypothetical protein n=1 Tax=Methylobacterium marchantiae TaxID=600331 RepID=UPI00366EEEF8
MIALYAFVLQVFLGTLMPLPMSGHADPLCSGLLDGMDVDRVPVDETPAHGAHKLCCPPAAAMAGMDQLGGPASIAIAWSAASVVRFAWRDEDRPGARGPPGSIPHPRGPPIV